MEEKSRKLLEMFQELQAEFEGAARKKFQDFDMEEDMTWIVGPDDFRVAKGPCADQSGCTDRCKPNLCYDKGVCEAKHICGYRCRVFGSPCMAQCKSLCYSQPV